MYNEKGKIMLQVLFGVYIILPKKKYLMNINTSCIVSRIEFIGYYDNYPKALNTIFFRESKSFSSSFIKSKFALALSVPDVSKLG